MNMATAINVFASAVVRERRIPFEISSSDIKVTRDGANRAFQALREQAKNNGVSDLTSDEINEEIDKTRRGEIE